jgi:NAD(P)-dependent dehydrogenase (short-subunit alcohol dehydrogenase family)
MEVIDKVKNLTTLHGFDVLKKADSTQLVNFLNKEHPQTIALILSHLNPDQTAEALVELPEELRTEVVFRIATLGKISPQTLTQIERVVDELGTIDVLVNTPALIVRNIPLVDVNENDFDKVVNTKVKGYFLSCQAAAKVMIKKKRGSIINFSGTLGIKMTWGRTAYHIAQSGAITLTKVLAYELGEYNIRANAVAPGYVEDTPFSAAVRKDPEFLKSSEPEAKLGRLVTPIEIANLIVYLASDTSSFITGQTILLDGGALL